MGVREECVIHCKGGRYCSCWVACPRVSHLKLVNCLNLVATRDCVACFHHRHEYIVTIHIKRINCGISSEERLGLVKSISALVYCSHWGAARPMFSAGILLVYRNGISGERWIFFFTWVSLNIKPTVILAFRPVNLLE